jgi:hypothetical protein
MVTCPDHQLIHTQKMQGSARTTIYHFIHQPLCLQSVVQAPQQAQDYAVVTHMRFPQIIEQHRMG